MVRALNEQTEQRERPVGFSVCLLVEQWKNGNFLHIPIFSERQTGVVTELASGAGGKGFKFWLCIHLGSFT